MNKIFLNKDDDSKITGFIKNIKDIDNITINSIIDIDNKIEIKNEQLIFYLENKLKLILINNDELKELNKYKNMDNFMTIDSLGAFTIIFKYKNKKLLINYSLNNNKYKLIIDDIIIFHTNINYNYINKYQEYNEYLKNLSKINNQIIFTRLYVNDKTYDITDLINMYHGPNYDFYINIKGISKNFNIILNEYLLPDNNNSSIIIQDILDNIININL